MRPIQLPSEGSEGEMWRELLDLSEHRADGWSIVGALMVSIHAFGGDLMLPRLTQDIDVVVEVRGVADEPRTFASNLTELGWDIPADAINAEGVGHRFRKGKLTFDLLAPEGLGEETDLTTLKPLVTIAIPGGTQALRRTTYIDVDCAGRAGVLPVPDLIGAIVVKSCAAVVGDAGDGKDPARHLGDLALLYAVAEDPRAIANGLTRKDRQRIGAAGEPHWAVVPDDRRSDARAAFDLIVPR